MFFSYGDMVLSPAMIERDEKDALCAPTKVDLAQQAEAS